MLRILRGVVGSWQPEWRVLKGLSDELITLEEAAAGGGRQQ